MGSIRTSLLKHLDATAGGWACRAAGRWTYLRGREIHLDAVDPAAVRRVLVIRPGGIGDMLLLLPVLQALRRGFPDAEIDVVGERRNLAILQAAAVPVRGLPYDRHSAGFLAALVRTPYDAALDFEQFHNFSAFFAFLSGAPVRVGFNINPLRNPIYTHLAPYDPLGREHAEFARLLAPLGIGAAEVPPFEGCLADREWPAPAAPDARRPDGAGYVVVHPGASGRFKQWAPARYGAVARRLQERGLEIVALGDRGDADAAATIARCCPRPIVNAAGRTSLAEAAGLIKGARLFLSGDSGLAHLAAALGIPCVTVFGPSDERKWGACGKSHRAVVSDVPCRPCCIFGYRKPCHSIACLDRVSAEQVHAAVAALLG